MDFGKVETLWRYPVKSLIGERLSHLNIDTRGVCGDRAYAISDLDGKLGSGKNSRRFTRLDGLSSLSAETVDDGVLIKFPDGIVLTSRDQSINKKLSQVLGQTVTLTKESETPHFDDGAVHILTTGSLSLLDELLPDSGIDPRRFRPNIVVDSQCLDQDMVGKAIRIGGTTLEITHKTQRCRMVTIAQQDLESRPEILGTVSKSFGLDFGVYARVLSIGSVSIGDRVEVIQQ
ncbi:MAG: MOSC domain-containing protein [Oceanicoccus sp.]